MATGLIGKAAGKAGVQSLVKNFIDISHHNGIIDWNKVKATGVSNPNGTNTKVDASYIKMTEGVNGRDKKCGFNAAECYRVGLPIGYYHFCTLNREDEIADATEEANYVIKRLMDLPPFTMPFALDVESTHIQIDDAEVEAWVKTFYSVIEKAGYKDYVLYSYSPFLREHLPQNHSLTNVRLWAARYGGKFPMAVQGWGQKFWAHQYSNVGKVAGIKTNVDLNKIL